LLFIVKNIYLNTGHHKYSVHVWKSAAVTKKRIDGQFFFLSASNSRPINKYFNYFRFLSNFVYFRG
jgi:hypothetical protein